MSMVLLTDAMPVGSGENSIDLISREPSASRGGNSYAVRFVIS